MLSEAVFPNLGTLGGSSSFAPTPSPTIPANTFYSGYLYTDILNNIASRVSISSSAISLVDIRQLKPLSVILTYKPDATTVVSNEVPLYDELFNEEFTDTTTMRYWTAAMVVDEMSIVCAIVSFLDSVPSTPPSSVLVGGQSCIGLPYNVSLNKAIVGQYAQYPFEGGSGIQNFALLNSTRPSGGVGISDITFDLFPAPGSAGSFPTPSPSLTPPTPPPVSTNAGVTGTVTTSWHFKSDCSDPYNQEQVVYGLCQYDTTLSKWVREITSAGVVTNPSLPYNVPIVKITYSDSNCQTKVDSSSANLIVNNCQNHGPFYVKTTYVYSTDVPNLEAANTVYEAKYTSKVLCQAGGTSGLVSRKAFPTTCFKFIAEYFTPATLSNMASCTTGGSYQVKQYTGADCTGASYENMAVGATNDNCASMNSDKTWQRASCVTSPAPTKSGSLDDDPKNPTDKTKMIVFATLFGFTLLLLFVALKDKFIAAISGSNSKKNVESELVANPITKVETKKGFAGDIPNSA